MAAGRYNLHEATRPYLFNKSKIDYVQDVANFSIQKTRLNE